MSSFRWGVPDWKDADVYKADLPMTMTRWRWEFLRRRKDYREDWLLYFEPSFRRNVEAFRSVPVPPGVVSWEDHFSEIAEMPGCREKYGIQHLLDPSRKVPGDPLFVVPAPHGVRYASKETFDQYEAAGKMLIAFDLQKPLPKQFRKAKDFLERVQAEQYGKSEGERAHVNKWTTYLRVLDAHDAGETFEAIGMALLIDEGKAARGSDPAPNAYQVWEAANRLMFNWPA